MAVVENGDRIRIDLKMGRIDLIKPQDEMDERLRRCVPRGARCREVPS
ncbi:MAG: hypothetical protein N3D82_00285 [Ignisphaera sp.]|nr:hypothetical protein [Ignisphaera sp.]MCX8167453.1 hypothetical protein [Ignisphaera sp.]MDW8084683.1 hypothetical protein [Ignisphaera sp.]